ncbi:MAG TPA: YihY/virulence factor BrkB family protein [Bryobacteraceae bacterium]|nr:YihY/virulence factor BrkB family protein [Bryobacteraceae bacterium]
MHIINDKLEAQVFDPLLERTRHWHPTVRYLSQTEVHVYALSIAASVMLSLYPFLTVMFSLARLVYGRASIAEAALTKALTDYFPGSLGDFIQRNLVANLDKAGHGRFQVFSLILLMLTANGVFEPLEVALNRAWGVVHNRTYLRNQAMSLGLILLCGGMVIGSAMLTAVNQEFIQAWIGHSVPPFVTLLLFKIAAVPLTMLALFLTYWLLPNRKVPARPLIRVSVIVGAALEGLKYVALFVWPWLDQKLSNEYGVFKNSVEVILFTMVASFIVLAGAEWTARHANPPQRLLAPPPAPLRGA